MPGDYSEELVELVALTINDAANPDTPDGLARCVLDALSSAGRLVPEGERRKVVKVWYRSLQADGAVWCETSNQREVVELSEGVTDRFEQLVISEVKGPWTPWTPAEPAQEER